MFSKAQLKWNQVVRSWKTWSSTKPTSTSNLQRFTFALNSYSNPDYPCEVFDIELQDPLLVHTYVGLPPLPLVLYLSRFIGIHYATDVCGLSQSTIPTIPGMKMIKAVVFVSAYGRNALSIAVRCTFYAIEKAPTDLLFFHSTISNAVTFERSGVFFNPSRASPRIISARPTTSATTSLRLNIDTDTGNKIGICVTAGMCMSSHVETAVNTYGAVPRQHKYINIVMHNQDWEQWEAFVCFCFGKGNLFANITDLAIQIGTRLSKVNDTGKCKSLILITLLLSLTTSYST
jgi:hypothetical protein